MLSNDNFSDINKTDPKEIINYKILDSWKDTRAGMGYDAINPTRPAQPQLDQAYETNQNPASKVPAEVLSAQQHNMDSSRIV